MPNIAIYEGGKAARMNGVSRITTDDGNDGKIVWVPQSDRQTGTLHVSKNGTYRAEDEGLHSWSKVTVRLAGAPLGLSVPTALDPITGAEIPTGELGELEPVPPAGLEPIESEPISTEEAERIIEEAGFDPSDLDPDSPNYDDAMEAIADALGTDPEDVKVIDPEKNEDVKKEQPKVEDKGQKVVGTDPATGLPTTITPSGKESAMVPDELRIVVSPRKTSYEDGDTIDYTGIKCAVYANGEFWRYAGFDELSFPVTTAVYDGEKPEFTDGNGVNVVMLTTGEATAHYSDKIIRTVYVGPTFAIAGAGLNIGTELYFGNKGGSGSVYATMYNGKMYVKAVDKYVKGLTAYYYKEQKPPNQRYGYFPMSLTNIAASVGFFNPTTWPSEYVTAISVPVSTTSPLQVGPKWFSAGSTQVVPVNWSSPYGGTLSCDLKIRVTYTEVQGM